MTKVPIPQGLPTWCEIDLTALKENVRLLQARLASTSRLGVVVKSQAYGHGVGLCAPAVCAAGAAWLIVNSVAEAMALAQRGLEVPIYICGPTMPQQADQVVQSKARLVVYDIDLVLALNASGQKAQQVVPVHLKLESGTHRQGLALEALVALAKEIAALPWVKIEGLTTHYADIEDTTDHRFARQQLATIENARHVLNAAGVEVPMLHSANSAAALLWPETHGDLVRVGIAAYGLWPSRETYATALQRAAGGGLSLPSLAPVLSWRARISQVKTVPAGAYIGYGRTFRATHPMRIGVVPVGYYEGYDRRLSNLGHVLVHGVRAPVRGRVCMNMLMIDVSDIPRAQAGTCVTLLGKDGDEAVDADAWAAWIGGINYEVISRIHPDVPRIAVGG